MKKFKNEIDISAVRQVVKGEMIGNTDAKYDNVSELSEASAYSVCFYENEKYLADFQNSHAGLVIIPEDLNITPKPNQIFIKTSKPYIAFMTLVTWWLATESSTSVKTVSDSADIHPTAKMGNDVHIAPYVVIEENVTIGNGCSIGANSVIMSGVSIGENTRIFPNVTIYADCHVGSKCILHAGVVIGADGFGFVLMDGNQIKIPQVGNVVVEDDVEICANTCIDRSTIGTTIIKRNTKIDNLVQIGHNCTIEEHAILCSQVGLAGNTHIGKTVYLAGQVGVAGHLKVEDNTMVGAQSGVANTLPSGKYFGSPAISAYEQKKIYASMKELPRIVREFKKMKSD